MEKQIEINDNNYPNIYCRFRPSTKKELEYSQEQISPLLSKTTLNINTSKEKDIYTFDFNHIFLPKDTQQDVYDNCAKKSVENFLLGYNSAIIIHGQNKTGKSYTMTGKIDDNNLKGIIPRVVKDVFEFIFDNENLEFIIKVSIIDIYKDKIKDLITNNDINLIEDLDNDKNNFEGIHEKYINNENEALKLLEKGINNKAKFDYNINLDGKFSKSNFIFILKLIQNNKKENIFTKSELIFIETSGEEISYQKDNLNNKDQPIPFLFNKIFNGNYRPSLIITCSPSIYHQEITLEYLRFAEKMKKVRGNAKINEEINYDKLKEQLKLSETKIKQLEKLISIKDKDDYNNDKVSYNFDDIFKNILDCVNNENKENLMENLYHLKERYNYDIDNLNKKINDLEQKIKINIENKNKFQKALINQQTKNLEYNNILNEFKQFITELKTSKEININQKKRQIIDLDIKLKNIDSNNNNINDINNIDIDNTSFKKENKVFNNLIIIKDIELFYINNNKNQIIRNNSEEIKSEKYAQTVVNQSKIEKIELDYEKDIKYLRHCLEENKDIILELKNEIINLENKNKILENNALLNERKIRDKNLLLENNIIELKKKYEESQVKRLILEDKCRKLNKIFMNKKMNWLNSKEESINKSISTPKNIIKILKGDEENKI